MFFSSELLNLIEKNYQTKPVSVPFILHREIRTVENDNANRMIAIGLQLRAEI